MMTYGRRSPDSFGWFYKIDQVDKDGNHPPASTTNTPQGSPRAVFVPERNLDEQSATVDQAGKLMLTGFKTGLKKAKTLACLSDIPDVGPIAILTKHKTSSSTALTVAG